MTDGFISTSIISKAKELCSELVFHELTKTVVEMQFNTKIEITSTINMRILRMPFETMNYNN